MAIIRKVGLADAQKKYYVGVSTANSAVLGLAGEMWSVSDRTTIAAGATVYYEMHAVAGYAAIFTNRQQISTASPITVDVIAGATFTQGATQIIPYNLDTSVPPGGSQTTFYRGATGVSGGVILEHGGIPVGGGNSAGSIASSAAPRRFVGPGSALLKVTNTGAQATDFSVFITFFEEVVG